MNCGTRPIRSNPPAGFTLLELLIVITILGLVAASGVGLVGPWAAGQRYRSAISATKQAFTRGRLLAETNGGAVLTIDRHILKVTPTRPDALTIRVALPRDWTVEREDFSDDFEGLAEFDASGSAYNGSYYLTDPYGNETLIEYMGLSGQFIVHKGDER